MQGRQFFGLIMFLCAAGLLPMVAWAAPFQPFQPLPASPPIPAENPQSPRKIELGKQLFFDFRWSSNGTAACMTCHNVFGGGDDGRARSIGLNGAPTKRNAASLWNVGFYTIYFRDGRARSLEEAIEQHLVSDGILGHTESASVATRVSAVAGYVDEFSRVFGDQEPVSVAHVTNALASFLRTLVTQDSAFDQYLRGKSNAISDDAKRGFQKFVDSGCASCHFYVNVAGPVPGLAFQMGEGFYELFPNFKGSEYDEKYKLREDIGRYQVSGVETDRHMWRVASLRNVAVTPPYFHNGSVATLDEAVRVMAQTQLKQTFTDAEVSDVVSFLQTLTGEFPIISAPRLPSPAGD